MQEKNDNVKSTEAEKPVWEKPTLTILTSDQTRGGVHSDDEGVSSKAGS